jgi:serine/threonine protein kinase
MGVVYRALDRTNNKIVALKLLRPEIASDADSLRRFENEVLLARDIRHPNLCQAYGFHCTSTSAFVTMEYLEGVSLRDRLERGGRLDVSEALRIANQICDGLSELHKHQVVHRDLKPENVVIQPTGNVKLVDFGLARRIDPDATATIIAGTPAYMAPEQMAGRYVDDRTDIYAFGVLLVELFSGKPCPAHRDSSDWLRDVPEVLHEMVIRCLHAEMAQRPRLIDIAVVLACSKLSIAKAYSISVKLS